MTSYSGIRQEKTLLFLINNCRKQFAVFLLKEITHQ